MKALLVALALVLGSSWQAKAAEPLTEAQSAYLQSLWGGKQDQKALKKVQAFSSKIAVTLEKVQSTLTNPNLNPSCQGVFKNLGVTVPQFLNLIQHVVFSPAEGNAWTWSEIAGGNEDYQPWLHAQLAQWKLSTDATISGVFSKSVGLHAFSVPFGPFIFIRNTSLITPEILVHETLHKLQGAWDTEVQRSLGLKEDAANSITISIEIRRRCF